MTDAPKAGSENLRVTDGMTLTWPIRTERTLVRAFEVQG